MTTGRSRPRYVPTVVLVGVLCAATACGSSASSGSVEANEPKTTWEEPASYAYTLTSTTQVLAGTFRVKVRDGSDGGGRGRRGQSAAGAGAAG
ncbi:hypothetical protein [Streptomyces mirabilis]|uniref:hypothetical protein n=1 Tax=Streptomyces mirabilis TaxID=68239 RepID=UPI00339E76EA